MQSFDLYNDIAVRTGGDIYIGVVGPVRTGKSTFIKRFMDLLVLPNIIDSYEKERAQDEMPQSAAGRTIMTTQPKFIPNEAVEIKIHDTARLRVRMVDCVGYLVSEAMGYDELEAPRMVRTPWVEGEIPFKDAAEIGTRKVIEEHSTIGVVLTTDGSITDIPRDSYVKAEEQVVSELKKIGKPFIIVLNSSEAGSPEAKSLQKTLEEKYDSPVVLLDVLAMTVEDINNLMEKVLFEFPVRMIKFDIAGWANALKKDHWLIGEMTSLITNHLDDVNRVEDFKKLLTIFDGLDYVKKEKKVEVDLAQGKAVIRLDLEGSLFYKILGEECDCDIKDDFHLMSMVKDLVSAKKEYDKIESALKNAGEFGYGIVIPSMEQLKLEEPEIVKQGNRFGVKLKASAPSLHLIKVDIQTEVSPIVGTERQSQEMMQYFMSEFENDPKEIWSTDIFGKSLHELVKEGLSNKLNNLPDDVRDKMQQTLTRIVNEGDGGVLCILL
jgi:stage IV sporulation protein A